MQVQCTKCSRPIALTDIVESSQGRLSHANCAQPGTLTMDERTLLFVYCTDHVVAQCLPCGLSFRLAELAADPLGDGGRVYQCPRCRKALTENVRAHLYGCAKLPSEIRLWAWAVREAAQRLVKEGQQLRDRSDVLIREAALFAQQRALREVMSGRIGPPAASRRF
jgi:hypothetical protein